MPMVAAPLPLPPRYIPGDGFIVPLSVLKCYMPEDEVVCSAEV